MVILRSAAFDSGLLSSRQTVLGDQQKPDPSADDYAASGTSRHCCGHGIPEEILRRVILGDDAAGASATFDGGRGG